MQYADYLGCKDSLVGVFAGDLSTSTPAIVHCKPSILDGEDVPAPPREDVYSQIVELCEEASAAIIITKTADDFGVHNTPNGKELLRIPAFAFLYLLGNAEKHGYHGVE